MILLQRPPVTVPTVLGHWQHVQHSGTHGIPLPCKRRSLRDCSENPGGAQQGCPAPDSPQPTQPPTQPLLAGSSPADLMTPLTGAQSDNRWSIPPPCSVSLLIAVTTTYTRVVHVHSAATTQMNRHFTNVSIQQPHAAKHQHTYGKSTQFAAYSLVFVGGDQ
jgi:hypothetical protein